MPVDYCLHICSAVFWASPPPWPLQKHSLSKCQPPGSWRSLRNYWLDGDGTCYTELNVQISDPTISVEQTEKQGVISLILWPNTWRSVKFCLDTGHKISFYDVWLELWWPLFLLNKTTLLTCFLLVLVEDYKIKMELQMQVHFLSVSPTQLPG